jgi:hypothetical protein
MSQTVPLPLNAPRTIARAAAIRERIPWYIWCYVAAVSSAAIGGPWDISWHMSIGRDTFWSPPHLFIYLCGVLGGFASGYLVLASTFSSKAPLAGATVRMWGFRGPLGAFLATWGAVAMLTSAPYDDWWHNAYGLDTKILSPPHVVLLFGLLGIRFGALLLVLGEMNRASGALKKKLTFIFLLIGALVLGLSVGTFQEMLFRNFMHSARFYLILAITAPVVMIAIRDASGRRWGATISSGIMFSYVVAMLWILPLFPAEPKLGPVYHEITHFIPLPFPILLVAPAFALDLLRSRWRPRGDWRFSLAAGPLFVAVLLAVQWPFADFLMSPASRNWVFGTHYFPYFLPPASDLALNIFTQVETTQLQFLLRLGLALALSVLSVRAGIGWGRWMQRLRR